MHSYIWIYIFFSNQSFASSLKGIEGEWWLISENGWFRVNGLSKLSISYPKQGIEILIWQVINKVSPDCSSQNILSSTFSFVLVFHFSLNKMPFRYVTNHGSNKSYFLLKFRYHFLLIDLIFFVNYWFNFAKSTNLTQNVNASFAMIVLLIQI